MDAGNAIVSTAFQFTGTKNAQGTSSTLLSGVTTVQRPKTFRQEIPYGTTSGKCDIYVCQVRTLNGAASEELNMYDGSLLDIFGAAAAIRTVRRVMIWQLDNADATTASSGMTIGNAGTNPNQLWFGATTHTMDVNGTAGSPFSQGDSAGKTVGSGTARIKVLNKDGSNKLTYLIFIAGASV